MKNIMTDEEKKDEEAWKKVFINPIAEFMHKKKVAYLEIRIEGNKVTYVMDTKVPKGETPK